MVTSLKRVTFGRTTIPESWIFAGGAEEKAIPIILSVFLIETEHRKILVDAGCDTMPGFAVEDFVGPVSALQDLQINPEQITDVILTHSHHDHIEAVSAFPNATVYIQKQEYEQGKKYIPANTPVVTFLQEYTVEDGVRIVCIGGHTTGSCVVECRYNGKDYVLCGDECYSLYNIQNRAPTATSCSAECSRAFIERYTQKTYQCLLCHQKEENSI